MTTSRPSTADNSGEMVRPIRRSKAFNEEWQARAFLAHLGWPTGSTVQRPTEATYEFECVKDETGERLALEIKNLTWGPQVMRAASKRPSDPGYREEIKFPPADLVLREEAKARLEKANQQLSKASATRRCVLLVWQYHAPEHVPLLQCAIGSLPRHRFPSIDEVWLTTTHLLNFCRIDLAH